MGWHLSLTRSGCTFQRGSSYTMPISAYGPTAWIAKKKKPEAAPLYHAAYIVFHEIVEHLILKYPHHVNAISGGAGTALHSASTSNAGHVKVLHSLLKYGADVNARGASGVTALQFASGDGHPHIVHCLLDHGADPYFRDEVLWKLTSVSYAAKFGNAEIVRSLS